MKTKNRGEKVISVLILLAGAFLAAGVMLLFHACGPKEDGSWMSCHYAQLTVFALALGVTGLGLLQLFGGTKASLAARILIIACAAAAAVIPGNVIHLCMMNEMRCRAVMRPCVILFAIVIIVLTCAGIAAGGRKKKKTR